MRIAKNKPLKKKQSNHQNQRHHVSWNPEHSIQHWFLYKETTVCELTVLLGAGRGLLWKVKVNIELTSVQSGLDMSLKMWQALVVTELAPEHHRRENSHRSFTTHRFTVTFLLRSSLMNAHTQRYSQSKAKSWFTQRTTPTPSPSSLRKSVEC